MSYREVQNSKICVGSNGYAEALPSGYDGVKVFPLLVFIHGLGEQGNGNTELFAVSKHGPLAQVKFNGYDTPFVMVAPQFLKGYWPGASNVKEVIDWASKTYKVDAVFLTGLSMGGGATWDYAQTYPTTLKAILPTCGALAPNNSGAQRIANEKLPVYATHNNGDQQVPYSHSTGWVNAITGYGGNAKLLTYNSTTHDSWTATYDLTRLQYDGKNWADWMMQYYKGSVVVPPVPTKITVLPTDEQYVIATKGFAQTSKDIYGSDKVISGTSLQALYNAERWGIFDYKVPVPNGDYIVILHFAELFHSATGKRVFNVDINGNRVLTAFDIMAEVPKFTALQKSFNVKVTGGNVLIEFDPTVDNAKISFIEIIPGTVTQTYTVEVTNMAGVVLDSKVYNEQVKVVVK